MVLPKVLIHRLSTDSICARQIRLWDPRVSLCDELVRLYRSEGFLPALVDSFGLGNGDAFALALTDQITLKLSEGSQHREH